MGEIAQLVRTRILSGAFPSGRPVREVSLAKELLVSRAPVREALRLLEERGMLIKMPRSSYAVVRFDESDLREQVSLRVTLETMAANLAFGRSEFVAGLTRAIEEMSRAVARSDYASVMGANRAFHLAIVDAASHTRLSVAYARLSDEMELAYLTYGSSRPDISGIVEHHQILLDFAISGDRQGFLKELSEHICTQLAVLGGDAIQTPPANQERSG